MDRGVLDMGDREALEGQTYNLIAGLTIATRMM
jgi:hypothetical protein